MVMFVLHYVYVCITEEFDKNLKCIRNGIYIFKKHINQGYKCWKVQNAGEINWKMYVQ